MSAYVDTPRRGGRPGHCRKMQDDYYQQSCRAIRCDAGSSQRRVLAGTPTAISNRYRAT